MKKIMSLVLSLLITSCVVSAENSVNSHTAWYHIPSDLLGITWKPEKLYAANITRLKTINTDAALYNDITEDNFKKVLHGKEINAKATIDYKNTNYIRNAAAIGVGIFASYCAGLFHLDTVAKHYGHEVAYTQLNIALATVTGALVGGATTWGINKGMKAIDLSRIRKAYPLAEDKPAAQ